MVTVPTINCQIKTRLLETKGILSVYGVDIVFELIRFNDFLLFNNYPSQIGYKKVHRWKKIP